jgi:hypothetical protein
VPTGQSQSHADAVLNVMRGADYPAFTPWLQVHVGDPGPAGTANPATVTDRRSPAFAAPSGGHMSAPAVSWEVWPGEPEDITHVTLWDAEQSGTFKLSAALPAPETVEGGDTLNLSVTLHQAPLAS